MFEICEHLPLHYITHAGAIASGLIYWYEPISFFILLTIISKQIRLWLSYTEGRPHVNLRC